MSHTHKGLWVFRRGCWTVVPGFTLLSAFLSEPGDNNCQPYRLLDQPSDSPTLPPVGTWVGERTSFLLPLG